MDAESSEYSVYVGNLECTVPVADMEEILYELFLQAGPLEKVFIPSDPRTGWHKSYGFVEFDHKDSVLYSIKLLDGICLFGRPLKVRTATKSADSATAVAAGSSTSVATTADGASSPAGGSQSLFDSSRQQQAATSDHDMLLHQGNAQNCPVLDHVLGGSLPALQSQGEPSSASQLIPQNGLHPTLGQRLSPLPASDAPGLSPAICQNGARFVLPPLPPPPLPANGLLPANGSLPANSPLPASGPVPLFGHRHDPLPPPPFPPVGWDASTPNHIPPFFPPPPPPLLPSAGQGPLPFPLPLPSLLDLPPPPPPPHSSCPHSGSASQPMGERFAEQHSNAPTTFHHNQNHHNDTRMLSDHTHTRLHQSRVVHIDDKPSWVTQSTKEKIRDYHLHRLGETLSEYKEKFTS